MQREQAQRVLLTQTYIGCDCVDQQERKAGTGHRFANHCAKHGNKWYAVATDPIPEDDEVVDDET